MLQQQRSQYACYYYYCLATFPSMVLSKYLTPQRAFFDQTSLLGDLIFVNNNQNISYKTVIPTGHSDHNLIACVRNVNSVKYESETIRCRDCKNYDVNIINEELLCINWDGVYNSNSPNQGLNVMKSILKDTVDRHAPFVTKRVKGKKSPWMSKEIQRHMNIRDKLSRKAHKSKKQID